MQALLIAVQFLTCLPVRLSGMPTADAMGRSLLYYPLVGALLGALLVFAAAMLDGAPALLQAALLLAVWVALTGALHLDGLADAADAWLGGFGDRERTLAIMKDPRSGPAAVVVLVLTLLLKFAALVTLIEQQQWAALLLVPVLGRSALLALFLSTPYVRAGGLGQALAEHLPKGPAKAVLVAVALFALALGGGWPLLVGIVLFILLRHWMMARLGGTTGDTAGALLELLECALLVSLALG
ncbi:adenosylcobinamide-GDP ribazoletransferase [Stutzerimonas nosocomialis]|uniref:Adenosylcobinamide-GDP ribazoletransferase n=1 Tax=Stutzerimonas nosocomialis TaxID=1056496 RepID=A0A5R9QDZ6_9GAMM|nr:adenosylcobinamide-GDP ribazoletransferase [Stutzerimonas nosocomialis]TLX60433.1 adenosylcobinamide-GDP ribazoletransferase [Stutzerimonas nosocomialis]TLX62983.1 adenosylcobinamide-GDP ribazoletransferase [Stutzerimonas nosocomialis]